MYTYVACNNITLHSKMFTIQWTDPSLMSSARKWRLYKSIPELRLNKLNFPQIKFISYTI